MPQQITDQGVAVLLATTHVWMMPADSAFTEISEGFSDGCLIEKSLLP